MLPFCPPPKKIQKGAHWLLAIYKTLLVFREYNHYEYLNNKCVVYHK